MKKFFRFLFPHRKKVWPSLLNELSVQLTVNQLSVILRSTSDSRLLLEVAAAHLGVPEECLIQRISERTGIPSLSALPQMHQAVVNRYTSVAQLAQAGAALITSPQQITGIACCDPQLAANLYQKLPQVPVHLCSWSIIKKCLDHCQQPTFQEVSNKPTSVAPKEAVAAPKPQPTSPVYGLLSALVKQLSPYAVSEAEICFEGDKIQYQFRTLEGKKGSGEINRTIRQELLNLLEKSIREDDSIIKLDSHLLHLQRDKVGLRFHVNWGSKPQISQPIVQTTPVVQPVTVQPISIQPVTPSPSIAPARIPVADSIAALKVDPEISLLPEIMVIDDNEQFGNVLSILFKKQGYQVIYANSGAKALELFKAETPPQLIICDVHMPEMNGFSFVRTFRTLDQNTPILMLTSDEEDETQVRLLGEGADAFVAKSEHPTILYAHVKRLLAKANRLKAA